MASVPSLENSRQLAASIHNWAEYSGAFTYVLLKPGTARSVLDHWLPQLTSRIIKPYPFNNGEKNIHFEAQALSNITPGEVLFHDSSNKPSAQSLVITSVIAFIVLLSACFNYTNLSIARSLARAKEISIRKVSGAFRRQIFVQFLTESVIMAFLSLILAYMVLPALGTIQKFEEAVAGVNKDITLFAWFLLFSLGVGLLAGALPAWILSAYRPVQVLKNVSGIKLLTHMTLRKSLVVFQFSLSLIFVIILLVYYQQSYYMATADYGYSRKNIVIIPLQGADYRIAASELGRSSEVERIAAVSGNFGYHAALCKLRKHKGEPPIDVSYYAVDHNFIPNTEVRLLAGNNFSTGLSATQEQYIILNKEAVNVLNLGTPEEALGKMVWLNDSIEVQVVGSTHQFSLPEL
jgi:putative ABC transport system permease protein